MVEINKRALELVKKYVNNPDTLTEIMNEIMSADMPDEVALETAWALKSMTGQPLWMKRMSKSVDVTAFANRFGKYMLDSKEPYWSVFQDAKERANAICEELNR